MITRLKRIKTVNRRWLAIWLLIYSGFILIDLFFPQLALLSAALKYVGIFLCAIYAHVAHKRDTQLVIAMFLTLLADTVLMLVGAQIIGVYIFCFAQMFHTLRLSKAPNVALRGYFVMLFFVFACGTLWGFPALYVMSFTYAATLITNLILAWRWYKAEPTNIYAVSSLLGFILFICCDINVALAYISQTGGIPAFIAPICNFLVFVFYYPSQVLISNSSTITKPKIAIGRTGISTMR
ncbi:MAG: hypothetical protein LBH36_01295 [Candidatus Nomurabacteria bacterium]|jgi:hypothetical protein|nr:hypothetical protein [Candidatus Nomurabacteria bacterium]